MYTERLEQLGLIINFYGNCDLNNFPIQRTQRISTLQVTI